MSSGERHRGGALCNKTRAPGNVVLWGQVTPFGNRSVNGGNGSSRPAARSRLGNGNFRSDRSHSSRSAPVKSFGRREAYESRRGTNPRCAAQGLWGFDVLVVRG